MRVNPARYRWTSASTPFSKPGTPTPRHGRARCANTPSPAANRSPIAPSSTPCWRAGRAASSISAAARAGWRARWRCRASTCSASTPCRRWSMRRARRVAAASSRWTTPRSRVARCASLPTSWSAISPCSVASPWMPCCAPYPPCSGRAVRWWCRPCIRRRPAATRPTWTAGAKARGPVVATASARRRRGISARWRAGSMRWRGPAFTRWAGSSRCIRRRESRRR